MGAVQQIVPFSDERLLAGCLYCGSHADTRDHVPSRVLLDEHYPENLPIVPACGRCNAGFSLDEEYLACLIECVIAGSTDPARIRREKVARILSQRPALQRLFELARVGTSSGTEFRSDESRVRNVLLKLARGHAAFELHEVNRDEPISFAVTPLCNVSPDRRAEFERPPAVSVWPEVGSRAMQRIATEFPSDPQWLIVQPDRYRYLAALTASGTIVRMVLSEYLGAEVRWLCAE